MEAELVGRLSSQEFPQADPILQEHDDKLHTRKTLIIELVHANDSGVDIDDVRPP